MLQGFKSRDLGNQVIRNCQLMILLSKKWWQSNSFMQGVMCIGTPSCMNIVVVPHHLAWRARITDCSNNEVSCSPVIVHLTLPIAWNKWTAAISVTTESSACNNLQLDLLDHPTWILPFIGCEGCLKPMVYDDPITSLTNLKESVEHHLGNIPHFCLQQSNMRLYAKGLPGLIFQARA